MPAPDCCLCGQPCEPWVPGQEGWGHNPDPLGTNEDDRCCDYCNASKVIPARVKAFADYHAARAAANKKENN